jgi:uncharacterized protein DUF4382
MQLCNKLHPACVVGFEIERNRMFTAVRTRRGLCLLATLLACAGCSVQTDVAATGATSSSVSHLYLTVQAVELHGSATATAGDPGWATATLASPQLIDLAQSNSGSLQSLIKSLSLPAGTYQQLQVVLADASAPLTTAAQSAGLSANAVVQYVDASGASRTLNVELPSPSSALLIPVSLTLKSSSPSSFFGGAANTPGATAAGGSTAAPSTIAIDIAALRTFLPPATTGDPGALLTPGLAAYDTSTVGGIHGSVDLSALASGSTTGYQGLVATAELVAADGTRYVAVKSAPIQASGSFDLYPLTAATSGTTSYDLVIHGPGVQTVVVTAVPVSAGASTPTAVGRVALFPATFFAVNTPTSGILTTGGSQVDFYQTLPGGTIPHLIEFAVLSPYTQRFPVDIQLSTAPIAYGVYSTSGISLSTAAPGEGAGTYQVTSEAPLRAPSAFGERVSAPGSTATVVVPPPVLGLPSGVTAGTLAGTLTIGTPSRYDSVFVLVSRGGQLVDAIDLSASLGAFGSSVSFSDANIPAGTATAVYDVAVRAWNSANPTATLVRATATAADLRQGSDTSVTLQLP